MKAKSGSPKRIVRESINTLFYRVCSIIMLIFAVHYWLMIVGFYEEEGIRFDTMAVHWRIAAAVLSVLLPIVALGLWGMFAWGPALWMMAIIIELVMYLGYSDLFGQKPLLITFHLLCIVIFLVLLILQKRENKSA